MAERTREQRIKKVVDLRKGKAAKKVGRALTDEEMAELYAMATQMVDEKAERGGAPAPRKSAAMSDELRGERKEERDAEREAAKVREANDRIASLTDHAESLIGVDHSEKCNRLRNTCSNCGDRLCAIECPRESIALGIAHYHAECTTEPIARNPVLALTA